MQSENSKHFPIDSLNNFIINVNNLSKMKIGNNFENSSALQPCKLLVAFKPLLSFCKIFGVCPLEYTKNDSELIFNKKSWWFFYSVFIFIVASLYLCLQLVSIGISISNGSSILDIFGQSQWFHAGVISFTVTLFIYFRSEQLIKIYNDWSKIESDVDHLFVHSNTCKSIKVLQIIYGIMMTVSAGLCGLHVIKHPHYPAYLLYYIKRENGQPYEFSTLEIYAYAIFQMFFLIWFWVGYIMIEVTLCIFATVFIQCMNTILAGINEKVDSVILASKTHPIDVNTDKTIELPVLSGGLQTFDTSTVLIGNKYNLHSSNKSRPDPRRDNKTEYHSNSEYLLCSIKDLQKIASLISQINSIFGPVLLIDFGLLIFMVCGLIFLPIKYLQEFEIDFLIVFGGNGICFVSRLIILVICLGNVFPASTNVNTGLAKVLTHFNLESSLMNPILAHLSVFSSNPICFTAWDFFPITRGTLLAAFSLISTYLVILVQIKT